MSSCLSQGYLSEHECNSTAEVQTNYDGAKSGEYRVCSKVVPPNEVIAFLALMLVCGQALLYWRRT